MGTLSTTTALRPHPMPVPPPYGPADTGDTRFRQLRHHTKNALQTILNIVDRAPELRGTARGEMLGGLLQKRILLAAQLSDTLFGLTAAPGTFRERLTGLSEGLVRLMGDPDAEVVVFVTAHDCPPALEATALRIVNELVGNAIKHGMHARLLGRIHVAVRIKRGRLVVSVCDDGWGCGPAPHPGEGLTLANSLAGCHGGAVHLRELRERTVASVDLDLPR